MRYDLAVIGGGSAGLSIAAAAAHIGQRVVLFEKGRMGGDCLNCGCVPSKSLIAIARRADRVLRADSLGLKSTLGPVDSESIGSRIQSVIGALESHDSQERFEKLGVEVLRHKARFSGPDRIEAGGKQYRARRYVIATGARPILPEMPGLAHTPHLTYETFFEQFALPQHLVIIGAGFVGVEIAQACRRLGSEVSLIDIEAPLAGEEFEFGETIRRKLASEGINILAPAKPVSVRCTTSGIAVSLEGIGEVAGSHLLVAVGRRPQLDDLGLDAAGVKATAQGISTDRNLRTSNRRIYAIGDAAGKGQFTHLASHHAAIVFRHIFFGLSAPAMARVPRVLYTDPELAVAGLAEDEARSRFGQSIVVHRRGLGDNDRAIIEGETEGSIKLVLGRRGRILGVTICGHGAGELIQPWLLAMANRLTIGSMARAVLPYPTVGEIGQKLAIDHYARFASNSWARRIIGLIAAFKG